MHLRHLQDVEVAEEGDKEDILEEEAKEEEMKEEIKKKESKGAQVPYTWYGP